VIRAALAAAATFVVGGALAVPPVVVRVPGPGPTGPYLAYVLAQRNTRVLIADTVTLPADSTYSGAVIVIGRRVTVSAPVNGDVIVIGGNLFIHPRARIADRGIAIGGAAYPSLLASVRDGIESHRDFTFDTGTVAGALELRYRDLDVAPTTPVVTLPGIDGLLMPSYDRSSGLSVPIGALVTLDRERLTFEPEATYRSQLGLIDPSVRGELKAGRQIAVTGYAGRETRSNDGWIDSPLSNTLNTIILGRDTRNWYRASAGDLFVSRRFETSTMTATYRLGGQFERASSARPDSFPTAGPWSIHGSHSDEGMLRGNPQIQGGDITSVIAGARYDWTATDIKAHLDLTGEIPTSVTNGGHFGQLTIDGQVAFPTFGMQRYRFYVHSILTRGDTAPAQRFGYLGGPGTLGTVEPLLSIGGDEVLLIENRYEFPVPALTLPLVGYPTIAFRHLLGAAGIQRIPTLTQIIGLRVSVMFLHTEMLRDTKTGKTEANVFLSLSR
jgi:hypothetical protein